MQLGLENDLQQPEQEPEDNNPPADPADSGQTPVTEVEEESYGVPRGAFAFVILMMVFFVVYFFLTWTEIFVLRGS